MRIGICCFPSFGGSGVVASELALALAEGGDAVHVVTSTRPPRLVEAASSRHTFVSSATWRRWRGAASPCSPTRRAARRSAGTPVIGPAPGSDRGAIVARYREVYRATLTPGGAAAYRPSEALDGKVNA